MGVPRTRQRRRHRHALPTHLLWTEETIHFAATSFLKISFQGVPGVRRPAGSPPQPAGPPARPATSGGHSLWAPGLVGFLRPCPLGPAVSSSQQPHWSSPPAWGGALCSQQGAWCSTQTECPLVGQRLQSTRPRWTLSAAPGLSTHVSTRPHWHLRLRLLI